MADEPQLPISQALTGPAGSSKRGPESGVPTTEEILARVAKQREGIASRQATLQDELAGQLRGASGDRETSLSEGFQSLLVAALPALLGKSIGGKAGLGGGLVGGGEAAGALIERRDDAFENARKLLLTQSEGTSDRIQALGKQDTALQSIGLKGELSAAKEILGGKVNPKGTSLTIQDGGTPVEKLSPIAQKMAARFLGDINIPIKDEELKSLTVEELKNMSKLVASGDPSDTAKLNHSLAAQMVGQLKSLSKMYNDATAGVAPKEHFWTRMGQNYFRKVKGLAPGETPGVAAEQVYESRKGFVAFVLARSVSKGTQSDQDIKRALALLPDISKDPEAGKALFKMAIDTAELGLEAAAAFAGEGNKMTAEKFDKWIALQEELTLFETAANNKLARDMIVGVDKPDEVGPVVRTPLQQSLIESSARERAARAKEEGQ